MDMKEIRNEFGYTIEKMAQLCGVNKMTYYKWENKTRKPDQAAIRLIELVLMLYREEKKVFDKIYFRIFVSEEKKITL